MTEQTTQPGVRVNKALWQEFRDDIRDRKGVVKGHMKSELETALREYINASQGGDTHDRLRRMENTLETIEASVVEQDKKKKDSGVSSEVENKLREVRNQIERETDGSPKVHDEVVELAIRDNAGTSAPTLRKYKELLQQDRELFEHPANDSVWFTSPEDFVLAVNSMRKAGRIQQDRYDNILSRYGEEWWLAQQDGEEVADGGTSGGAFQ